MRSLPPLLPALLMLVGLVLAGCEKEAAGQQAPPPPQVEVLTLETQPVTNILALPGRVQAVRVAEIRARVTGILEERLYEEGSDVEAGEVLFRIDPREMRASLQAARAALERAQATAANAAQDLERYQGLVARQAISQQEYDAAQARLRTARADVEQAKAQLQTAQLNLNYTRVQSPIDGRAGRAQVTEGALVSASEATLLTTVEQFDPVYVIFSQSSSELLSLRAQVASGALQLAEDERIEVRLLLENGAEYPLTGYLDFQAMSIDRETGTVEMRATFPNPERLLLPGQFVRARVQAGIRPQGLLLPQRAVMVSETGPSVMLVNEDNVAVNRPIETGELRDGQWVVRSGLQPGDRVIVEGWQKARPGAPVRPTPFAQGKADIPAARGDLDEPDQS